MSQIPGIAVLRNMEGEITHVTVDVQQHAAVLTLLESWNLIKTESFEEGIQNGYSIEASRKRMHEHINQLWQK